jgi:hypothetical protein
MADFTPIAHCRLVPQLLGELAAAPELWDQHNARKAAPGSPHTQMSDIWLRYNDPKNFGPRFNDEHLPVNYPAWHRLPSARRICFDLMALTEGEVLGGVLITKIPSGGAIAPHEDKGWHVGYYSKYYVCLGGAPGAIMATPDEELCPLPGQVHLFDNRKVHWVENKSLFDRITLIVCIRTNKEGFSCHSRPPQAQQH